ncbi:aminotransferase-like domain-containing protein [Anaerotignum sp.]|uniref:aminotransferase-like domain-containing protein n=1 Tax=Anaerotignum sp. TaxID=2039241 RepID=UPI0027152857|nr:PLP-dependent aminotransferase family protein [Anaerotignum sp.]
MEYQIANRLRHVQGSIIRELFKLANDPDIIGFGGGNPSPETFPVDDIARIAAEVFACNPVSVLQYGLSEGYPALRETMKKHLLKTEGISFEDNELYIVSGGQQSADLVSKTLINEGDIIITEEPAFVGCLNTFRSYGAKLVGVPVKPDGMDIEKLEETLKSYPQAKLMYIISCFQNPTGFTTSAEKRKQIYELAQKYDVMIFEDNPYGEIRFSGEHVPPIKTLDADGRVIYTGSFSKVMAPAFRLGFMVFNKGLSERLTVAKQCADTHSNVLFQYICNEYMTKCDYAAHIASACEVYRKKADLMLGEMEKKFHPDVTFNRPEGGLFVMAFLPEGMDSFEFVQEGIRRGVACVPGVAFVVDQSKPSSGFRLNYSTPSDEQIVRGVDILGKLTYEWLDK